MKISRKIIRIDEERCDGCGLCVPSCAEGAIEIVNGKAILKAEKYCDGLGACIGECPQGALRVIEAQVDTFDAAAVGKHILPLAQETSMPCGCPSTNIQIFLPEKEIPEREAAAPASPVSALSHWPVQIRLVPPTAPFLKGADLLVAADCTPVAYPCFHQDFLKGKVLLMGCPKFDDTEAYLDKFVEIFRRCRIRKVTILSMEVPCCRGLPLLVEKAAAMAGVEIPATVVVIGVRGGIVSERKTT